MSHRFYTIEQEQQIIAEYNEPGATMTSVGDKWFIASNTVKDILQRHNVPAKITKFASKKAKEKALNEG